MKQGPAVFAGPYTVAPIVGRPCPAFMVISEKMGLEVFQWFGKDAHAKCEAVARALNELEGNSTREENRMKVGVFSFIVSMLLGFTSAQAAVPTIQPARDQMVLTVVSRSKGAQVQFEACKDRGHYWSTDRANSAGYAYYTCGVKGVEEATSENWDVAPETMSVSMFIDGEAHDECALVSEGFHASLNNRYLTYTCR